MAVFFYEVVTVTGAKTQSKVHLDAVQRSLSCAEKTFSI